MRIVGGSNKGKPIKAPARSELSIRPTSDRVRESLFNILTHRYPHLFEGGRVLDLFAGTGALGFEALSRGAAFALFVDNSPKAHTLISENRKALGLQEKSKLLRRDATKLGPNGDMAPFDLVFLDPPYQKGWAEPAIETLLANDWLDPQAVIVLEESAAAAFIVPQALVLEDERRKGDTITRIMKRNNTVETRS
ncbi:MAG: 16S rRNA (guanine(966)-N(2))-methyltransferase RsmD [Pseudomonadota bacterium]